MTEGYAEDSHIVGSAIAGSDHGLGDHLVGNAEARREVRQGGLHVAVQADPVFARDHDFSGRQALEASVVLRVHVLREVDLPAQAVIDGQFRSDAPGVLNVGEEPVLALGGIGRVADVTAE